jgi:hypothetical protein
MNTSKLPGVNRLKQFWRVSKKTQINLLKKSLISGGKKVANLQGCYDTLALSYESPIGGFGQGYLLPCQSFRIQF